MRKNHTAAFVMSVLITAILFGGVVYLGYFHDKNDGRNGESMEEFKKRIHEEGEREERSKFVQPLRNDI